MSNTKEYCYDFPQLIIIPSVTLTFLRICTFKTLHAFSSTVPIMRPRDEIVPTFCGLNLFSRLKSEFNNSYVHICDVYCKTP